MAQDLTLKKNLKRALHAGRVLMKVKIMIQFFTKLKVQLVTLQRRLRP
jgi:hypothetical protein